MAKTILVIGNGFDINLGLPTSYSSLIESEEFTNEIQRGNRLCLFLNNRSNDNWNNLERNLVNYADTKPKYDEFYNEYLRLTTVVSDYYSRVDNFFDIKESIASNLIIQQYLNGANHKGNQLIVLNFNYTLTIAKVLKKYTGKHMYNFLYYSDMVMSVLDAIYGEGQFHSQLSQVKVVHPHGESNNIILGVSDYDEVGDYIFLKKSVNRNFIPSFRTENLLKADSLIFFGFSFGETDHHYFKELFSILTQIGGKEVIIYYFGEEDRLKIIKQLYTLTNNDYTNFLAKNNVCFKDSSDTSYEVVGKFK